MPRKFPHEREEHRKTDEEAEEEDLPENQEKPDEGSNNPVEAIFAIIDRYYEGLKREKEGMGVD